MQCERCKIAIQAEAGEYSSAGELLCPACFARHQIAETTARDAASKRRLRSVVGVTIGILVAALYWLLTIGAGQIVAVALAILGGLVVLAAIIGLSVTLQSRTTGNGVFIAFLGVLFLGGAALGVFGLSWHARFNDHVLAPFQPHLESYLASVQHPSTADVTFRGKLIVVDIGRRDFDNLYFDLPSDVAAKTPEEVGAIAVLTRGTVKVGRYTNGADAFVATCHVTVIDKDTGKVLRSRDFRGGQPPGTTAASDADTGISPDKAVVKFLASLQ